ncbi:MAG: crossover junction endodeoxyribonuclease RuvC [Alphaproteobacteria bacterium]|jgi:crossover junction endodeoxyribonuclease RuvC|nr:crossover junction endodeoxyribonuclease RuvC [Alphaproteobacteria bacterium]MCV6598875.1 crossover junction endodeoxyribonuclease RuvC [Alphaproteobacteria bacterium]
MKIIGIDPGLQHTGWGVIEINGNKLTHIANGTIHSTKSEILSQRIKEIFVGLQEVISKYNPEQAAVEEVFVNMNPNSTLKLGQARGACLLAPAMKCIETVEYSTTMVKKSVVGTGRADKNQIKMMVKMLLGGCELDSEDSADALAVAICHSHNHQTKSKIK